MGAGEFLNGVARVVVAPETGLILSFHETRMMRLDSTRYKVDILYNLRKVEYGTSVKDDVFRLPRPGMREVKKLSVKKTDAVKNCRQRRPEPHSQGHAGKKS
jgi:hypothetical protein